MPSAFPPPLPQLPSEAPGAKAARTCGLLSIIFAVTCLGIPVAIVLGIVALVQQAKAKRLAGEFPLEYRVPTASGMVMGILGLVMPILMLPFVGVVSAIAIPAFVQQKNRAVDKVITNNLMSQLGALVSTYEQSREVGLDQPAIQAALEQVLRSAPERNPANPQAPAFRYAISIVAAASEEEARQQAEAEVTSTGEVVFVLAFPPEPQQPGYLAGAARLKAPIDGAITTTRAATLN